MITGSTILTQETIDRFFDKVGITANKNCCWEWISSKNNSGYGNFSVNGVTNRAHRVSYFIFNKNIPQGMCVLHKCDNRSCVNPNHLFLGTHKDNMCDMDTKGRRGTAIGEKNGTHTCPETVHKGSENGQSKLTESLVIEIRSKYAKGEADTYKLADLYNVSQAAIWYAVKNKTWKHI